ncbi:hypothetical protein G5B40_05545 [Pikeienuella piscinae]|uniref:Rap1a immunity protein domain-containing protein n=1 Tax=Pikeienuella piscinae TaxID=2748098 RepID=A0A7L5BUL4_9RHOB|nr:Rap1a/Tai family immunity protein [Pikeienuella piscinae]QIE54961.1 hypothetical protein G5B40_05545 [Pikeienuella piscinae]
MIKQLLAFVCSVLLFPTVGITQQIDGNELYETCTDENPVLAAFCVGYIIGYVEGSPWGAFVVLNRLAPKDDNAVANALAREFLGSCPPENASNSQLTDVVKKYLEEHPETRHESARTLIWQAFSEAFPCGG